MTTKNLKKIAPAKQITALAGDFVGWSHVGPGLCFIF
jgi:hypothetical protein